jgi:hypothetical protein
MNNIWKSFVLIILLMGCASASDAGSVALRPGEAMAEKMFNNGIGQPWVGGNPTSDGASYSMYSQYFSMHSGSAPLKHIEAPKKSYKEQDTNYGLLQLSNAGNAVYTVSDLCHIHRRQFTVDTGLFQLVPICQRSTRIKPVVDGDVFCGR